MSWIFSIVSFFWPIIIIGLILYFARRRGGKTHPSENKEWYLQLALSKEDAVSQWFLLLSVFFLGVTLLTLNRDFGDPLSWRTIVFLTSIIGLIVTYYFKVISTLIFSLIGITSWWGIQAMQWIQEHLPNVLMTQDKGIKTSSILAGLTLILLLFYVVGYYHEKELKYKRFSLVYLIFGIISITGALFIFSSKFGLIMLDQMTKGNSFFGSWEITISLLVLFAALVGLTLYSVSKNFIFPAEAVAVLLLAILFGGTAFLPEQSLHARYNSGELSANGILLAIIFNFAIFFELLGLIFSGYLRKEEWLINLGTFFLILLIIVKYFDWFFTFLDKSLFFIGAGILLFAVGWFMEKSRRYMISNLNQQQKT